MFQVILSSFGAFRFSNQNLVLDVMYYTDGRHLNLTCPNLVGDQVGRQNPLYRLVGVVRMKNILLPYGEMERLTM